MYRLSFIIDHWGCWACQLTKQFVGATAVLRSSFPRAGKARYILSVRPAAPQDIEAVRAFLEAHPNVGTCQLVELLPEAATFVLDGEWQGSVSGTIMERGGFLLAPTLVEAGEEHYAVGLVRKDEAASLLEAISRLGTIRATALVRDTFPDHRLTEAQKRALRTAIAEGYYDFPRQTSPTALAKELGLAKSTLLEHLQKAEAKIILSQEGML